MSARTENVRLLRGGTANRLASGMPAKARTSKYFRAQHLLGAQRRTLSWCKIHVTNSMVEQFSQFWTAYVQYGLWAVHCAIGILAVAYLAQHIHDLRHL